MLLQFGSGSGLEGIKACEVADLPSFLYREPRNGNTGVTSPKPTISSNGTIGPSSPSSAGLPLFRNGDELGSGYK